jgi:hypothetical protein
MKTRIFTSVLISLLLVLISACQPKEPLPDDVCPIDEITGEYDEDCEPSITEGEGGPDAYPVGEAAYPATDFYLPVPEDAYPITQADLMLLVRTWRLAKHAEDGIEIEPPPKTLSFTADGSYVMTTEVDQHTGIWTTILLAVESTLILNRDTGETQYYQIINLSETELILHTLRDSVQIEDRYLPAN